MCCVAQEMDISAIKKFPRTSSRCQCLTDTPALYHQRQILACHRQNGNAGGALIMALPNSRGWVDYLTHDKPATEEEPLAKKARIESPPTPPQTGVTLPNECRLLLLGLDGSGKTTSLYQLFLNEVVTMPPTFGYNGNLN